MIISEHALPLSLHASCRLAPTADTACACIVLYDIKLLLYTNNRVY